MKELHAKCFVNEKEAIVTSLNLLNGSEEKNREMGVRLDRGPDAKAYAECVAEVRSILAVAEPVPVEEPRRREGGQDVRPTGLPQAGHCIRCGKERYFNPDYPLCEEDFRTWVQYGDPDFQERACHWCGKAAEVSMAGPICARCLRAHGKALSGLDQAKGDGSGMRAGGRTWRRPFF